MLMNVVAAAIVENTDITAMERIIVIALFIFHASCDFVDYKFKRSPQYRQTETLLPPFLKFFPIIPLCGYYTILSGNIQKIAAKKIK
jgi:hypothetical protein